MSQAAQRVRSSLLPTNADFPWYKFTRAPKRTQREDTNDTVVPEPKVVCWE